MWQNQKMTYLTWLKVLCPLDEAVGVHRSPPSWSVLSFLLYLIPSHSKLSASPITDARFAKDGPWSEQKPKWNSKMYWTNILFSTRFLFTTFFKYIFCFKNEKRSHVEFFVGFAERCCNSQDMADIKHKQNSNWYQRWTRRFSQTKYGCKFHIKNTAHNIFASFWIKTWIQNIVK